ncbi:MAG TPA: hypothetical protein VL961_10410 [Acidimicrobiales bacterium]|nr:hypothetical protein [Acidimicrobiales bacterium]
MRIYSFAPSDGRRTTEHASALTLVPMLSAEHAHVVCVHLAAGDSVGIHEAAGEQLFCVVDGAGWVEGDGADRVPIQAWQAASWRRGERHGAGTTTGLTALVVEGPRLELHESLPGRS